MTTDLHNHLASIAAMIADPSRAKILCGLMDGRAYTATELSTFADVSASTTSAHLTKLESQGFISLIKQGRFRYYRLANEEVAKALETLMNLTLITDHSVSVKSSTPISLRVSRSCYNHLAGKIAVKIMQKMLSEGWVKGEKQYSLSDSGKQQLQKLGLQLANLPHKHLIAHDCLDWSERQFHLAGPLATQLLKLFEQNRWIERYPQTREAIWTESGKVALKKYFKIDYHLICS